MKFQERFNQHKLNYIISNYEKFEDKISKEPRMSDSRKDFVQTVGYDPLLMARKYLQQSENGVLSVRYNYARGEKKGRLFAQGGIGLQCLPVEIRNTIANEYFQDIDMVNCHPVCLLALCKKLDISCENLSEYVHNREVRIKEIQIASGWSRDDVKQLFLSIMNNGNKLYDDLKNNKTKFIRKFKGEMQMILEQIAEIYPVEYEKRKKIRPENALGSTMNSILCKMENDILQYAIQYFDERQMVNGVAVLCFDGFMLEKRHQVEDLLPQLEAKIYNKFKVCIKFKIKPMDDLVLNVPKQIEEYDEFKCFDRQDQYTWIDFIENYHNKTYASLEDCKEDILTDLKRVYAYVHSGSGFHVKKTDVCDNLFDILNANSRMGKFFFKIQDGEKVKKISFDDFVGEYLTQIPNYQSIVFDPLNQDPRNFNLWTGFKAKRVPLKNQQPPEIQLILKHLREVYCDSNDETYEYFLNLLHAYVRYPHKQLQVACFLYSKQQGTGKNTFLDFFSDYVIGRGMTHEGAGLDQVLTKFNSHLKGKKLVIVDEIASSSDKWRGNFDKMKTLITSSKLQIEHKGVDCIAVDNLAGYFFLSNNYDAIKLESSDRRYLCLKVSNKYRGNLKYFKNLRETFNQQTGDLFYSYLLSRGERLNLNPRSHLSVPSTSFKESLIDINQSSSDVFINNIKENIDASLLEVNDGFFTTKDLYELYCGFCLESGDKQKKIRKFRMEMLERYNEIRKRVDGKHVRGFQL